MDPTICVSVDDLKDVADILPDSFFSSAVDFATEAGKAETDVPLEVVPFMALSNPEQMLALSDKYSIGISGLEKLYLIGMIKLAETTDTDMIKSIMKLIIKHKIVDVIEKYLECVSYKLLSKNLEFFMTHSFIYPKTGADLFMIALNKDWGEFCEGKDEVPPEDCEYELSDKLLKNYEFINFEHIDNNGNTVLMVAIECYATHIALHIIENDLCDLSCVNKDGYDAIMLAAQKRCKQCMISVIDALFERKCYNVNILIRETYDVVTLLNLMIIHTIYSRTCEKYVHEILDSNPNLDILQEGLFESSKSKIYNRISNKIIDMNELMATHCGGSRIFHNACHDGNRELAERIMDINRKQLVMHNASDLLNSACKHRMTHVALRILELYKGKIKNRQSSYDSHLITDWISKHQLTEVAAALATREIV